MKEAYLREHNSSELIKFVLLLRDAAHVGGLPDSALPHIELIDRILEERRIEVEAERARRRQRNKQEIDAFNQAFDQQLEKLRVRHRLIKRS